MHEQIILTTMLELFRDGDGWTRIKLHDDGRYCLSGALRQAQSITGIKGDRTYRLLARSIRQTTGEAWKPEHYNDDAENYGDIHFLILWALALAEIRDGNRPPESLGLSTLIAEESITEMEVLERMSLRPSTCR
jgi:hypothetical protein